MFDLLDRPLVYIPVKWAGVAADENGEAVAVEHSIKLQVELLDSVESAEWAAEAQRVSFPEERARLQDDFNVAVDALESGREGAAQMLFRANEAQAALNKKIADDTKARNLATFRAVVKGWKEVVSNGRVAAFDDANINRILAWPGFPEAFAPAYLDALNGKAKVREGNSVGSLASGQAGEPTGETTKAATPAKPRRSKGNARNSA